MSWRMDGEGKQHNIISYSISFKQPANIPAIQSIDPSTIHHNYRITFLQSLAVTPATVT